MISISEFRRRVAALDGQRLETGKYKRGFTVRVIETGPEYTPQSSGRPRAQRWSRMERVLDRFNETHSFTPVMYHDITVHSSYPTAVLRQLFPSAG